MNHFNYHRTQQQQPFIHHHPILFHPTVYHHPQHPQQHPQHINQQHINQHRYVNQQQPQRNHQLRNQPINPLPIFNHPFPQPPIYQPLPLPPPFQRQQQHLDRPPQLTFERLNQPQNKLLQPHPPLPSPSASSLAPSQPPPASAARSSLANKKIKVRFPLEHTPDRLLALHESRIRSRWTRAPLKISFHLLSSQSNLPTLLPHWENLMSCPDSSHRPNKLPSSIDVYLPGRQVWDDYRMEMLDDRLTELGYPTKISLQINSTTPIDALDEHEQDLRQRLDLRKRLNAFLDDNPESDPQIPPIHGIFPVPTRALPSDSPQSSTPSSSGSPPSNSQPKPLTPVDLVQPNHHASISGLSDSSKPIPIPDSTLNPIAPSLKPTAPEFKPNLNPTHLTTQLDSSPLWGPPLTNSRASGPVRSSLSPQGPIQLDSKPAPGDDDLLTDSDRDEPQLQSNLKYNLLEAQERNEEDEQEDDIPLATLQHNLKSIREPLPKSFISVNPPDNLESQYDGDVDGQSDCTNPSDEEDGMVDQEDNSMLISNLSHHSLSPLSTPQNRAGRSHTFGTSSLNNFDANMSAGKGQPHNWINGSENEEGDLISNPSDEEEAELHQLHRTIIKSTYPERANSLNQASGGPTFKASTPTSRLLLNSVSNPDQSTNLAITVGRATGSVMSLGMLDNSSSHGSVIPNQGSTSSLNAFAPEFKPTVIFSSPLIANPRSSTKDSVQIQSTNLPCGREASSKPPVQMCSIGRGVQRPEMNEQDEVVNPEDNPSIILFEQPVSSAPFQVPPSFPTLSAVESAGGVIPTTHSRKMTVPQVEQPGKDNMRNFKFPVKPQSRMMLYQAQMSQSSSPAVLAPVLESQRSMNLKDSIDSPKPATNEVSGNWTSTPVTSTQQVYPSLVVDIPSSPSLAQIDSGLSVPLRQRSSFEDDSGSDLSISRPVTSERLDSSSVYELIPTQPRPSPLYFKQEEPEKEDEEDNQHSPSSVVSLYQLQEQKKQWRQLTAGDGSHPANSYHSGSETYPRSDANRQRAQPSHSVPLRLDVDVRRRSEGEPPQVVVPTGSPFSPFDGMMESGGSMYSFREDPPVLKLPPPTSHLVLTPTVPRMLSLKPSHNNLAQTFKVDDRRQSPLPHTPHHQDREELDGLPDISIRARNLNLSPSSPSARWLASPEEGNSKGSMMPTREISKTDVEDETLFSSRILEDKDEDSSSGDSSSDSSLLIETNSKRHHSGKNHAMHGLLADLERLLTRKLNGLRQDLGELHSLKVDWDSIKRDAIIDEITSLMDNILRSWSEPWKEKIAASVVPDQMADIILDAVNQWGGKTEDRLVEAISKLPSTSTFKDLTVDPEAIRGIKSELENVNAQLSANAQGLDLDSMTAKLSEAVKPQIVQLIDLASDKSETANLISKQLKPHFIEFQSELESMTKRIFTAVSEQNEKQTSSDGYTRSELLTQLAGFQADSQQRLLQLMDKQTLQIILTEIKKGTIDGFETIQQLDTRTEKMYKDLTSQVNQVSEELNKKLEMEVEKRISRRQETDNIIEQLRGKNSELEMIVTKVRSEHGKIRSERAVERERNEEDRTRLVLERDRLKESLDKLHNEHVVLNREKMVIEVDKNRLAGSVDELKSLVDQLNASLSSYKTQESQWQILKAEQDEKIVNLQIKNQISESQMQTIKTEMELKQKFYDTRDGERETELIRLKEKDLDQSNQIKKLIEDQIPLIKNFDQEIRDLIKLKSESDGEIRTLRKRISDQDEQIGNLHQSSASKQQALAMANQKLSELERRGKQESEGLKMEVEQLKAELNKTRIENEEENKVIQDSKTELENEVNRLRSEVEMGSVKDSVLCQNLSIELEQSNQRRLELEEELKSFKDLNELLKNQIEDLTRYHENYRAVQSYQHHHHHPSYNHHQHQDSGNRLMVVGPHGNSLDWKKLNENHHTLIPSEYNNNNNLHHELSLSIEEDGHSVREFVRTTSGGGKSLTDSMHNNQKNRASGSTEAQDLGGVGNYYRQERSSSAGTVKSFKTTQGPQPHSHPPLIRLSSTDNPSHHPIIYQQQHYSNAGVTVGRIDSPTPSRISISSRSVSMDHDGWWSSID